MKIHGYQLIILASGLFFFGCVSKQYNQNAPDNGTGDRYESSPLITGDGNTSFLDSSQYGADNTSYLQSLLDSEADTIVITAASGPWYTGPLFINRDNLVIIFEPGARLEAREGLFQGRGDCLLTIRERKNISLRGSGSDEGLYMRKSDYQSAPYQSGEWRHCLALLSTENVRIEGLTLARSGGDGIYLGQSKRESIANYNLNTTIRDCRIIDNHRQGISVISAENLLIENTLVSGTKGTLPRAGIDFEPNRASERFVNCRVINCRFMDNAGPGILIFLRKFDHTTMPLDITLEGNTCRKNFLGIGIHLTRLSGNPPGKIILRDNDFGFSLFNRIPRRGSLDIIED
jgi:hypothetical protein